MTSFDLNYLLTVDVDKPLRQIRRIAKQSPLRRELRSSAVSIDDLVELRDVASRVEHETEPAYGIGLGLLTFGATFFGVSVHVTADRATTLIDLVCAGIVVLLAYFLIFYYRFVLAAANNRLRTCVEIYEDEIARRRTVANHRSSTPPSLRVASNSHRIPSQGRVRPTPNRAG